MKGFDPNAKPNFINFSGVLPSRMVIQRHKATSDHWDLRLVDPINDYALSWAIPKRKLPISSGERYAAFETPPHDINYLDFEGSIPSGYGKGTVKKVIDTPAFIRHIDPKTIVFDAFYSGLPRTFLLKKMNFADKQPVWLVMSGSASFSKKHKRPIDFIKSLNKNDLDHLKALAKDPNWVAMPKIDGVGVYVTTDENGTVSVKTTKGIPIMFNNFYRTSGAKNSQFYGELTALDKNSKALPLSKITGLIRSRPDFAERKILSEHIRPIIFPLEPIQVEGKKVSHLPFRKKIPILHDLNSKFPFTRLVPIKETPVAIDNMRSIIEAKANPITEEGIVLRDLDKPATAVKYKPKEEHDVYVCDVFRGKGKYKNAAGGFYYSFDPGCKVIVGKVGGGFTDEDRRLLMDNKNFFKGKVAVISGMKSSSGKGKVVRHPIFLRWHLEKNLI